MVVVRNNWLANDHPVRHTIFANCTYYLLNVIANVKGSNPIEKCAVIDVSPQRNHYGQRCPKRAGVAGYQDAFLFGEVGINNNGNNVDNAVVEYFSYPYEHRLSQPCSPDFAWFDCTLF